VKQTQEKITEQSSEGPTPRDAPSDQLSTPPGGAKQSAELVPDVQLSPVQQPCLPDVAAGDSKDCFPISGEDRRERAKIERYWRMIQEQSENAERKKRNKARRAERRCVYTCACGATAIPRIGMRLAHGGPRCTKCSIIIPHDPLPALPEAPLFTPTEEEFEDPLAYIKSIQMAVFDYGICRIRPPPSWNPPRTFHVRQSEGGKHGDTAGGISGATASVGKAKEAGKGKNGKAKRKRGVPRGSSALSIEANGGGDSSGSGEAPVGLAPCSPLPGPALLPTDVSYKIIDETTEFWARLQKVAPRRSERGHAMPFICSFVAKHASIALGLLKSLDEQMRSAAFASAASIQGAGANGAKGDIGVDFPAKEPDNAVPESSNDRPPLPSPEEVERYFWEWLAGEAEARLLYASDVEGTAFPAAGLQGREVTRDERWSLSQIANHERSLLRFIRYDIPGVNTPMLYFGMLFSMFCWHVEVLLVYPGATGGTMRAPSERNANAHVLLAMPVHCAVLVGQLHVLHLILARGSPKDVVRRLAQTGGGVRPSLCRCSVSEVIVEPAHAFSLGRRPHRLAPAVGRSSPTLLPSCAFRDVESDPTLLIKKATMVPPSMLTRRGVRVCHALQRPGEFVVTLPQAYHAGFSHGFNAAEAVNFMLLDWLPYASAAARW